MPTRRLETVAKVDEAPRRLARRWRLARSCRRAATGRRHARYRGRIACHFARLHRTGRLRSTASSRPARLRAERYSKSH